MEIPYVKEIYDPIHGFIKFSSEEINIVDKLIFQRLHNICQLGTLHMVFPTARNTRFSHSLGVFAIVSKMVKTLKELPLQDERKIEFFQMPEKYKKLIRISALLHDIGHLPFSHCTEVVIRDFIKEKYPEIKISGKFHEWLGGEIIKKTDIYNPEGQDPNIIEKDRQNISQVINGSSKFMLLNQMLHSELDADRLDYLVRDSFSTGVSFGKIDLDQILRKTFIKKRDSTGRPLHDNILVYSTKAIDALDNFYYARMFMFNSVYYHKVKCYFDYLLSKSYRIMINSPHLDPIEDHLPIKPDNLLSPLIEKEELNQKEIEEFYMTWHKFDDFYLWNCMRGCWHALKKIKDEDLNSDLKKLRYFLSSLFRRRKSTIVWKRNQLKKVIKRDSEEREKVKNIYNILFKKLKKWIKKELDNQYDVPIIALNHNVDAPLKNIIREDPVKLNTYDGGEIIFHDPEEDTFHYLHNVSSSINYNINTTKFQIFRVYCAKENLKDELSDKINKKYQELKNELTT